MTSQFPAQGRMPALIPQRTESLWYSFSNGIEQMHEELLEEEEYHTRVAAEIAISGSHFIPIGTKRPFMHDVYQGGEGEEEGEDDEEEEMEDDDDEDAPTEIFSHHGSELEEEVDEEETQYASPHIGGDDQDNPEMVEDDGMDEEMSAEYSGYQDGFAPSPTFDAMLQTDDVFAPPETRFGSAHSPATVVRDGDDDDDIDPEEQLSQSLGNHGSPILGDSTYDPFLRHHLRHEDEHDHDDGGAHVYHLNVPSDLDVDLAPSSPVFDPPTREEASLVTATTPSPSIATTTRRRRDPTETSGDQHPRAAAPPSSTAVHTPFTRPQLDYWRHQPLSPTRLSSVSPLNAASPLWTSVLPTTASSPPPPPPFPATTTAATRVQPQRFAQTTLLASQVLIYEDPQEPDDDDPAESLHAPPDDHHSHRRRL